MYAEAVKRGEPIGSDYEACEDDDKVLMTATQQSLQRSQENFTDEEGGPYQANAQDPDHDGEEHHNLGFMKKLLE